MSFVVAAVDLYCSTNNILGISATDLLCIEETDSLILKLLFVLIFLVCIIFINDRARYSPCIVGNPSPDK